MKTRSGKSLGCLLAAVGAWWTASCGTTAHFAGAPVNTAVSGANTSDVRVLSVDGGEYGVEMIEWAEGGVSGGLDKPCYLKATFRSLNDALSPGSHNTVHKEVNVCGGGNYTNSSMQEPANISVRSEPTPLYANGVRTCDSADNDNERIKGVGLWFAYISGLLPSPSEYECSVYQIDTASYEWEACDAVNPTSSGRPVNVREKIAARTNCGVWDSVVECDPGQIASAVRVHISTDDEIVGLALACDTVEFEK